MAGNGRIGDRTNCEIRIFFLTLKSGCHVEVSQLGVGGRCLELSAWW